MAAKRTSEWIPAVPSAAPDRASTSICAPGAGGYRIVARVGTVGRTGVEMEALVAVSAAALTLYDMLKAVDRAMVIGPIQLREKRGGRSGDYRRVIENCAPRPDAPDARLTAIRRRRRLRRPAHDCAAAVLHVGPVSEARR